MSANPLDLLVTKLVSQTVLSADDRQALLALPITVQTVEPSTYLLRDGQTPGQCSILTSGYAFRHKLTTEGARQIVGLHVCGDPLDFQSLFLDVADHNVQTLTRAEIALVERGDLQRLFSDHPQIAKAVLVNVLVEASITREWVLNIGRRNAGMRLAHFLCEIAMRLTAVGISKRGGFELPMTQEQLGDALSLTSVHVNRTLKLLEGEGLIRRERRAIVSDDWSRLGRYADFNQRYLHLNQQVATRPSIKPSI